MGRGWEGVVLKLFGGKDFVFTVTGAEQVTERYRRVHITDGGMLESTGVHDSDHELPLRLDPEHDDLRTVSRKDGQLVTEVKATLPDLIEDAANTFVWIACDTANTRALTSYALKELAIPKTRIHSLGYWRAA
ncbi:SIP domain-containing protein [Kribbella sp. VKM Ac-2568]|uniref:SIP domain-containing protein n=1 Tax=Kribbella sp. VKM Ac-2568 TaxID=2512219 RepID=UPI00104858D0|nr:SIP domain-containing protein [Kribbella sp. VKM Ac-2568]TCM48832.1 siderophore-interacting protein [Kribbella sp. VKM Ac-2568]